MGLGIHRVEFNGLATAGDGLVQLPLPCQGEADQTLNSWVLRREAECLLNCGSRRGGVPFLTQDCRERRMRPSPTRGVPAGLPIRGNGLVPLSLLPESGPQIVMGSPVVLFEADGLPVRGD